MKEYLTNYAVLMGVWEETREIVKDSETLAGITGVQTMMLSFEYLFGLGFFVNGY